MAHRFLTFRRRLLTCLTALSLILFVVTIAVWIRGHFTFDSIVYFAITESDGLTQRTVAGVNYSGRLGLIISRGWSDVGHLPGWEHYSAGRPEEVPWSLNKPTGRDPSRGLGFAYFAGKESNPYESYYYHWLVMPHYFLALLFAILPLIGLRAILRDRRLRRVGHCRRCGYDLRASPERCPECGETLQHGAMSGLPSPTETRRKQTTDEQDEHRSEVRN